jgi:hypothetical protein
MMRRNGWLESAKQKAMKGSEKAPLIVDEASAAMLKTPRHRRAIRRLGRLSRSGSNGTGKLIGSRESALAAVLAMLAVAAIYSNAGIVLGVIVLIAILVLNAKSSKPEC